MWLAVDIILVLILAICVISGWKKGFVKTVMGFAAGILAFIAAYIFSTPVAGLLNKKLICPVLSDFLGEKLVALSGNAADFIEGGAKEGEITELLQKIGIDYNDISARLADSVSEGISGAANVIAEPVASAVSFALSFLGIFVIALIALAIITKLLDLAAKLPVLKQANAALGIALGIVNGLLTVSVLAALLTLASPYLTAMLPEVFTESLCDTSIVLRLSEKINLLEIIFKKLDLSAHLPL